MWEERMKGAGIGRMGRRGRNSLLLRVCCIQTRMLDSNWRIGAWRKICVEEDCVCPRNQQNCHCTRKSTRLSFKLGSKDLWYMLAWFVPLLRLSFTVVLWLWFMVCGGELIVFMVACERAFGLRIWESMGAYKMGWFVKSVWGTQEGVVMRTIYYIKITFVCERTSWLDRTLTQWTVCSVQCEISTSTSMWWWLALFSISNPFIQSQHSLCHSSSGSLQLHQKILLHHHIKCLLDPANAVWKCQRLIQQLTAERMDREWRIQERSGTEIALPWKRRGIECGVGQLLDGKWIGWGWRWGCCGLKGSEEGSEDKGILESWYQKQLRKMRMVMQENQWDLRCGKGGQQVYLE